MHRGRGAVSWSYPSIVGSGPNATILHYPGDSRQMQAGDLLLVDAACNFEYMSGDITRTYPVGGSFSPAQKEIYQIVLQAQDEGALDRTFGAVMKVQILEKPLILIRRIMRQREDGVEIEIGQSAERVALFGRESAHRLPHHFVGAGIMALPPLLLSARQHWSEAG